MKNLKFPLLKGDHDKVEYIGQWKKDHKSAISKCGMNQFAPVEASRESTSTLICDFGMFEIPNASRWNSEKHILANQKTTVNILFKHSMNIESK